MRDFSVSVVKGAGVANRALGDVSGMFGHAIQGAMRSLGCLEDALNADVDLVSGGVYV
ncbi:hypothetical protein [Thalassovita sp.]|uniref:hypothetical protein n=1 Tax=Thalassovita sp. TaxID=1979401 RepID=UPI002B269361|nr:hypothetical protein [Thalassovita sp.]